MPTLLADLERLGKVPAGKAMVWSWQSSRHIGGNEEIGEIAIGDGNRLDLLQIEGRPGIAEIVVAAWNPPGRRRLVVELVGIFGGMGEIAGSSFRSASFSGQPHRIERRLTGADIPGVCCISLAPGR